MHVTDARQKVLEAALRVICNQISTDQYRDAAAEAEYADDQLALAARELTRATDELDRGQQPVGWRH